MLGSFACLSSAIQIFANLTYQLGRRSASDYLLSYQILGRLPERIGRHLEIIHRDIPVSI